MAKARYSMGPLSVNPLQYDTVMSASCLAEVGGAEGKGAGSTGHTVFTISHNPSQVSILTVWGRNTGLFTCFVDICCLSNRGMMVGVKLTTSSGGGEGLRLGNQNLEEEEGRRRRRRGKMVDTETRGPPRIPSIGLEF